MKVIAPICLCYGTPTEESVDVFVSADWNPDSISGPFSSIAKTLPLTTGFVRNDANFVARVLDPVFWSPEFPCWYLLKTEEETRVFGIRKLECSKNSFYQNGRRRVIRAADLSNRPLLINDVDRLKLQQLEAVVGLPSSEVLQHASELGVMLLVKITEKITEKIIPAELLRWPCVGMLIHDGKSELIRSETPNHFLIQEVDTVDHLMNLKTSAHGFLISEDLFHQQPDRIREINRPILAIRNRIDAAPHRSACDSLQSALAPKFNLAGYVV